MTDEADLFRVICDLLLAGNVDGAESEIQSKWPLEPGHEYERREIALSQQLEVFERDRFTCRYCGRRTVFVGTLRLLSVAMPDVFPHHPNWTYGKSHQAYRSISTTCDHVVPLARGGTNETENLVTACYQCQSIKGSWMLDELGWSLSEPAKTEWNGLIDSFVALMDEFEFQNATYQRWRRLIIK